MYKNWSLKYFKYIQKKNIENITKSYSIINNQEKVIEGTKITDEELVQLENCKKMKNSDECFKNFYQKLTLKLGVNKVFSHMALLQKKHPEFIGDCHYISHGIGHAALGLYSNNVGKSFSIMSENSYYKNVASCGNGYFHGVIEEFVSRVTNTDALIKKLKGVCDTDEIVSKIDCYHGMGHAAYLQKEYDADSALFICDSVTDNIQQQFACHSGVFMEMVQDIPQEMLAKVVNGKIQFLFCESLDEKYKAACIEQHSSIIENYTKNKKDYTYNIGYCKQIENDLYRLHCIKMFVGRAVRIYQYKDIYNMCKNTMNDKERLFCTATFASRISKSIDSTRKDKEFFNAINTICKTLPFYLSNKCIDMSTNERGKIYRPTDEYTQIN